MTYAGTLSDAMSRVMEGLGRIEKSAQAPREMGGFKFVPDTAVMNALQPLLVKEQIMLSPRAHLVRMDEYDTKSGAQMHLATVELEMWVRRGEEELLWFVVPGQGADTSDKAVGKALTSAKKQGVLAANSVPTGDDPDAAANEETTRRATARVEERTERAAEVRRQVSLGELRDRVLRVADEHALVPSILGTFVEKVAPGKRFDDLTPEELIAFGKRIAEGEWDAPFDEPAADERHETEATVNPATTPLAGPTLEDLLAATGGTVIEQPVGEPAGSGTLASPPGQGAANPTGAAVSAPPSAPNPLADKIERAKARARNAQ